MTHYPFIFSSERKYRIWRHIAFWLLWWIFQAILYAFIPVYTNTSYSERMPKTMLDSLLFLPAHIFLSYMLMYFVIPVYVVKKKYLYAAFWTFGIILTTAFLSAVIATNIINPVSEKLLSSRFTMHLPNSLVRNSLFSYSLLAGLRGGITIGGLAAAIKLMKHWYVQEQRNLQLQKENIEAQLQLLKAQVHPHFLFNTLNNIYCYTQNTSPIASTLVMGLSDILRYMLYECNQLLTPLVKELKMIEEYINLEKIRYGNKLELHLDYPADTKDFLIAPLLLLPFVENCFKHGISNMLEHPWLTLHVSLNNDWMTIRILNSKPSSLHTSYPPGIGIENVRRRLGLLYAGKHELIINNEEDVFIVNLKLQLEKSKTILHPVKVITPIAVSA